MRPWPILAALLGIGLTCLGGSTVLALTGSPPSPLPPSNEGQIDCGKSPVRAIYFDFDRLDIRLDRIPDLDRVASWLSACPSVRVRLEGHTDDRYTEKHAMAVSLKLASSVHDYLVKKEIQEDRLETIAQGKHLPAASGKSEKSRALNRRVEILVCTPTCSIKSIRLVGTYVLSGDEDGPDGPTGRTEVGDPTRGWRQEDPLVWAALYLEIKPALHATGKDWTARVTRWIGDPAGMRPPLRLEPPEEGRLLTLRPVGSKTWPRIPAEKDSPALRHPLCRLEYDGKPDYKGGPLIYFLLGDHGGDGQLRFVLERDGVPACEIRVETHSPPC